MFVDDNRKLIDQLYQMVNPILKYRIDKELYQKKNISIEHYRLMDNDTVKYWLSILDHSKIHGREDTHFENAIAKLLEFGFTAENESLSQLLESFIDEEYWNTLDFMGWGSFKIVLYPFLIRAGYQNNKVIDAFLHDRLDKLEKTIDKYGYNFEERDKNCPKKYKAEFRFKINPKYEALPTIYDLYAFAFYPRTKDELVIRMERIVEFVLDERFQRIPAKAYLYDEERKRYYAAGSVYHACIKEERKLLTAYLLSHFKVAKNCDMFNEMLQELIVTQREDGFYEFEKTLLKEQKNCYHLYSGGHMGLGESRRNPNWRKAESTFWMLKILYNLEVLSPPESNKIYDACLGWIEM